MAKNRLRQNMIYADMARRYLQFHLGEDWRGIKLWGLFRWGDVAQEIEEGRLLTDMCPEDVSVWVWPSEDAYYSRIWPLLATKTLDELDRLAGR